LDLLQKKIILIEGKQTDHPSFFLNLQKKGYNVEIASTGNAALDKIREDRPMLVLIDAASLRTTCNRIVYRIKQRNPDLPVILIIDDTLKNRKISNKCDLVMTLPFTVQKLVNRIKLFAPSNSDCIRNVGDITLDKSKRSISVDNRYTLVTPRVVKLLEVLMDNVGKVVSRKDLFRKIWDTDYFDDMRSLDVHMQWLRKAIEVDPKNPQIITTIRGIGYSLYYDEEQT
jgi:DNA-binding response OmpR family regulator